jgi:hypothetical protein
VLLKLREYTKENRRDGLARSDAESTAAGAETIRQRHETRELPSYLWPGLRSTVIPGKRLVMVVGIIKSQDDFIVME